MLIGFNIARLRTDLKSFRKMDKHCGIHENSLLPALDHVAIRKQCPNQIGFFDMPDTLRNRAYSYITGDFINADDRPPRTVTVWSDQEDIQCQVQNTCSRLTDLLVVSKQFSKEFKSVWLSELTFKFSHSEIPPHGDLDPAPSDVLNFYHVLEFLKTFTEEERSHIKQIKVMHEIERTITYTFDQVERALNNALGDVWPEGCIVELEIKRMRAAPFNDVRTFTCRKAADKKIQIEVRDAKWAFVSNEVVGYWDAESEARMRMDEAASRRF